MADLTPFKYGKRKVGNRYNWEDLEAPYKFTGKPVFFVFGGNLTATTREANGYAKLIGQTFRQFTASTADVISVSYEGEIAERVGRNLELSDRARNNAYAFFNQTIWPALKNANTEQQVRNVLKKMMFFGHSAGANIIGEIMKQVENVLLYKFNEDQAKVNDILGEIQCFCYAPGGAINQNVSTFYVCPFYDKESIWKKLIFEEKGNVRTQYPEGFYDNIDPTCQPVLGYAKRAIENDKFIAIRKSASLILVTGKLCEKDDHSIACLKNRQTEYSAYVSDICESVLNCMMINALYESNYSFHDAFNLLKVYAERSAKGQSGAQPGANE